MGTGGGEVVPKSQGKKGRKKAGRKTRVTKDVLAKLEFAFSLDASDVEACLYANIGRTTLFRYEELNPEFRNRKEELKKTLTFASKVNIYEAIKAKDLDLSKWWLERRAKDEFSMRSEVTGAGGAPIELKTIEETKLSDAALAEVLKAMDEAAKAK